MSIQTAKNFAITLLVLALACLGPGSSNAWGQAAAGGTLNITVLDPSGAVIPNAQLELRDLSTNDVRRAATQASGAYSFINLPFGFYQLIVSAEGFQNQVFASVQIQTGLETDVRANLKVGATTETVTVEATETPLVQTESSTLASAIDTKQVVNLPIAGRNVWNLVYLTPGWTSTGNNSSNGTFNNLPGGAIGAVDFDGTPGMSNRFRSSGYGYGTTVVQARMENIAEMSVQTAQLDLSGNGTAAMRIQIVSRRGSNEFHGRIYEDFRNTALNSNSWINNAKGVDRAIIKKNEFGGSVGGPILKDKLFFFGTFAMLKEPNTTTVTRPVMNPLAQQGIFQYKDSAGNMQQVDLFAIARNNGLPSTVHPQIGTQLNQINGILNLGTLSPYGADPNLSTFTFVNATSITGYYPTVRIDYNASDRLRFNVSYNQNKTNRPRTYPAIFPEIDKINNTSSKANNKIANLGIDYTVTPTLINQFSAGYLYQYSGFSPENLGLDLPNTWEENWAYGMSLYGDAHPRTAISSLYPQFNVRDSLSWQRGQHSIVFGGSWFREQDHYWNGPGGWPYYDLGLDGADPAYTAITSAMSGVRSNLQNDARNLYATLVGRISYIGLAVGRPMDPKTRQYKEYGQYNLNEVQQSGGLWIQDRWRVRPNLTLNYGLRWDIVGNVYDRSGAYSSAKTPADLWGPTPIGRMFEPGVLGGVGEPTFIARKNVYSTSWVNPQPAVAVAWNPKFEDGILGKLIGTDKTVVRFGYSLRNYQEGAQNFWAFASNSGAFFYQGGEIEADPTATGPGYFRPGSLHLGDPRPEYRLTPEVWSPTVTGAQMFGRSMYTINPNIRQPYVQQWNFGIQRTLPGGNALEVRYVGNLGLHGWLGLNLNETNIFENGFLAEFRNAQNNMAINEANGKGSTPFNFGLPGQVALPIMTAALGNKNNNNWTGFATNLRTGAAGSMARALAGNTGYLCNLIGGEGFSPCAGYEGAGYAQNFWGINPWARTGGLNYLDAASHTNYHALQVEFRQRMSHGMQFNANYTWGHSLGFGPVNNLQSQGARVFTLRNLDLGYGPSTLDIRHTLRVNGTYDLPFGKGKTFLNGGGRVVESIFGGWTIGMITVVQSGNPGWISGGYGTVTNGDSGVNFNGITARDFQDGVSIRKGGNPWVITFDPRFIGLDGAANPDYLTPATTPGVFGAINTVIRAPMWWNTDLSVTKAIPITETVKFTLQGTATNAFNHPTFGLGDLNIRSTNFGQATSGSRREIELRANIEF